MVCHWHNQKLIFCILLPFHFPYNSQYAAVVQYYDIDIPKEFAIRGNAAIMKCQIPSFVADFVEVISWHTDQDETFTSGTNTGLWNALSENHDPFFLNCYPNILDEV